MKNVPDQADQRSMNPIGSGSLKKPRSKCVEKLLEPNLGPAQFTRKAYLLSGFLEIIYGIVTVNDYSASPTNSTPRQIAQLFGLLDIFPAKIIGNQKQLSSHTK